MKTGAFTQAQIGKSAAQGGTDANVTNSNPRNTMTSASLPTDPLSLTTVSQSTKTSAGKSIQANGVTTATAFFNGADSVSFDISSSTSVTQTLPSTTAVPVVGVANSGLYDIQYKFALDGLTNFSLQYRTAANSLPPTYSDVSISVLDAANQVVFANSVGHNDIGSIDRQLGSGTYTLLLSSGFETYSRLSAGTLTNGTANQSSFGTTDHFDVFLTGVPETSTWALLILGFGVVGGALRRPKVRPSLKYS